MLYVFYKMDKYDKNSIVAKFSVNCTANSVHSANTGSITHKKVSIIFSYLVCQFVWFAGIRWALKMVVICYEPVIHRFSMLLRLFISFIGLFDIQIEIHLSIDASLNTYRIQIQNEVLQITVQVHCPSSVIWVLFETCVQQYCCILFVCLRESGHNTQKATKNTGWIWSL